MAAVTHPIRRCLLLLLTLAVAGCVGVADPDAQPQPDAGHDAGADAGADAGDEGDADAGDEGDADAGDGGVDEEAGEPPELEGILDAHNAAREAEGAGLPPLTWDPLLAAIAQEWADQCESSNGLLLDHNPNRSNTYDGSVGENIAATSAPTLSGPDAVGLWMSEKADYNHETGACSGVCGHYTQVIWRDTLRVGCATVACDGLRYPRNVVCNYAPAGNVIGQRPY